MGYSGLLQCSEFILQFQLYICRKILKKKIKHCIAAFALSFFWRLYLIETGVGFCYVQSGALLGTVKISKILN